MTNLYTNEVNEYVAKIKNALSDYYKRLKRYKEQELPPSDKLIKKCKDNISLLEKTHGNLKLFYYHIMNKEIRDITNEFFKAYKAYVDISDIAFERGFMNNYGEKVFELVMADFINKKYSLKDRTEEVKDDSSPDFIFSHNSKEYYLECTTRAPSFLFHYMTSLEDFDKFYTIASIFNDKNKEFTSSRKNWNYRWCSKIDSIQQSFWRSLNQDEKDKIWGLFKVKKDEMTPDLLPPQFIRQFFEWIDYNSNMLISHKDLIPEDILIKLQAIELPSAIYSSGREEETYRDSLSRAVAQSIIEKLYKDYLKHDKPVIISISLSLINNIRMIRGAKELIDGILTSLQENIRIVLSEKNLSESEFNLRIKNLYAIVIDTSWYNWYPNINKEHMVSGYDNCYGVVYNTDISAEIKCVSDRGIFNDIVPYISSISLSI